ncbi:MAG: hypothetical protein ACLVEU_04355 [Bacteroides cellulosilyticus]
MVCFFYWQPVSAALRAQDQPGIKNIRTVVYEPLLKDTTWVTGKVVDYITFVKYDSKGRKMVENRLKPDGSPHGKLVYVYNPAGQVSRRFMQLRMKESAIVGAIRMMKKDG